MTASLANHATLPPVPSEVADSAPAGGGRPCHTRHVGMVVHPGDTAAKVVVGADGHHSQSVVVQVLCAVHGWVDP